MGLLTGFDMANAVSYLDALALNSYTSSSNGSAVDTVALAEPVIAVKFNHRNTAGSSPTLAISFEHSEDGSTGWGAIPAAALTDSDGAPATFTTAGATPATQVLALRAQLLKRYVRVVYTIGGSSSPAFLAHVIFAGAKRRID